MQPSGKSFAIRSSISIWHLEAWIGLPIEESGESFWLMSFDDAVTIDKYRHVKTACLEADMTYTLMNLKPSVIWECNLVMHLIRHIP